MCVAALMGTGLDQTQPDEPQVCWCFAVVLCCVAVPCCKALTFIVYDCLSNPIYLHTACLFVSQLALGRPTSGLAWRTVS